MSSDSEAYHSIVCIIIIISYLYVCLVAFLYIPHIFLVLTMLVCMHCIIGFGRVECLIADTKINAKHCGMFYSRHFYFIWFTMSVWYVVGYISESGFVSIMLWTVIVL